MDIITNKKNALLMLLMTAGHFLFAQIDKNATQETKNLYTNLKAISKEHNYYASFSGQISVPDFIRFYQNSYTLFEKDLKNIYEKNFRL
jgi:hypothetical protein